MPINTKSTNTGRKLKPSKTRKLELSNAKLTTALDKLLSKEQGLAHAFCAWIYSVESVGTRINLVNHGYKDASQTDSDLRYARILVFNDGSIRAEIIEPSRVDPGTLFMLTLA